VLSVNPMDRPKGSSVSQLEVSASSAGSSSAGYFPTSSMTAPPPPCIGRDVAFLRQKHQVNSQDISTSLCKSYKRRSSTNLSDEFLANPATTVWVYHWLVTEIEIPNRHPFPRIDDEKVVHWLQACRHREETRPPFGALDRDASNVQICCSA
jgi:hypothetical protein